jgi:transposase
VTNLEIFIYIVTDSIETRIAPYTGEIVGFDFGFKTFLTASNENGNILLETERLDKILKETEYNLVPSVSHS